MSLADPHRPLGRGTSKSKKALRRKTIGKLLERPQVSARHRLDVAAYYKMAEGGPWARLQVPPAAAEDVPARGSTNGCARAKSATARGLAKPGLNVLYRPACLAAALPLSSNVNHL